jgi:hypothetical protein
MKKIRIALLAVASVVGIGGAFASAHTVVDCGYVLQDGVLVQYVKGSLPGQYGCIINPDITCTFKQDGTRCDSGEFFLNH